MAYLCIPHCGSIQHKWTLNLTSRPSNLAFISLAKSLALFDELFPVHNILIESSKGNNLHFKEYFLLLPS